MNLQQLDTALATFAQLDSTHWPNHFSRVFLAIAESQPATYRQIAEQLAMTENSVARTVKALGTTNRRGDRGFGLVTSSRDPIECRRFVATLTPRGERLKQVLQTL